MGSDKVGGALIFLVKALHIFFPATPGQEKLSVCVKSCGIAIDPSIFSVVLTPTLASSAERVL